MPSSAWGEVMPGLFVGNLTAVAKLRDLAKCDGGQPSNIAVIVTVISVLSNANLVRFASDAIEKQRRGLADTGDNGPELEIRHVTIPLKDVVESDLLSVLPDALAAIDSAGCDMADNCNSRRICLVHCARGASRSVSVVIAYLLSRHPDRFKTVDDALALVRTVRPQAQPNIGFVLSLRQFEKQLERNA
ncbi:hypothetical protein ACHAXT_003001 [Thalassiosira profunda]